MAAKRIQKEVGEMKKFMDANPWCKSAGPISEDDINNWRVVMEGPKDSPYRDHLFTLNMVFPADFPFKPPAVKFETKIYHCNVTGEGKICLGILKDEWAAKIKVNQIVDALHSLMQCCNPDDPLVPEIAELFKKDKEDHDKKAKDFTKKNAPKS